METKKIVNVEKGTVADDIVEIDWFDILKKHLTLTTEKGINVVFKVHLHHLDEDLILVCEDGYKIAAKLKKQIMYQLIFDNALTFAKSAYDIGNRHQPINIEEFQIKILDDPAVSELIESYKGNHHIKLEKIEGYFCPNTRNAHHH